MRMSPPTSYSTSTAITTTAATTSSAAAATISDPNRFGAPASSKGFTMTGYGGGPGGGRSGKPPLPHFDDLVSVLPEVDSFHPIEALLLYGEQCIRRAESAKNFGRPDVALKDYVRATIVAVEAIPKNKDFPSLRSRERQPLATRHQILMKKIHSLTPEFEKIKEEIKNDNRRSGVQPGGVRSSSAAGNGSVAQHEVRASGRNQNGDTSAPKPSSHSQEQVNANIYRIGGGPGPAASSTSVNGKPSVPSNAQRPLESPAKPGGPVAGAASKTAQDLAERFANLRAGKPPKDLGDPSVNRPGVPVVPPRPPNPRATPAEVANISLISDLPDLPDLPKVPEAIYSPARGTVSHEAANLPSSNSRGMFSRTVTTPSSTSQHRSPQPNEDYFVPAHSFGAGSAPSPPERPRITIPDGDTITPEELYKLMKAVSSGFKILIADLRNRECFDDGHILSQSTVCIEPEILQREHISAEEVADSMILAPTDEQRLFSRRGEFDLVVFYDQDSVEINWRGGTLAESALVGFYNALRHYDYESDREAKPVKLLKGGIEGWIGLMGVAALKTSITASKAPGIVKPNASKGLAIQQPRARPIQDAEEARRWEETLNSVENNLVRNQDEFLRRYPSVSQIPESMTSPVNRPPPEYPVPAEAEIYNSLPSPPTRPPPTVPRKSYSGLRETGHEDHYTATKVVTKSKERTRSRPVGLSNPGVWCYGNASIQALFHSYGFTSDITGSDWQTEWAVPKRGEEKLTNPQLLMKIISNLFHWMGNGQFETMQCKTLMEYCCYVDSRQIIGNGPKGAENALGSRTKQQDAGEFIIFVMDHIHDETNRLRHLTFDPSKVKCDGDRYEHALAHWNGYRGANDSIIDKHWRGLTQNVLRCDNCGHTTFNHEAWDKIQVTVPVKRPGESIGLMDLLQKSYPDREIREDYKCDKCGKKNTTTSTLRLSRMPELLCISLGRFNPVGGGVLKTNTTVTYPIEELDLTAISDATPPERAQGPEWEGPFRYYCYAAIIHGGELKGGHYTAFVRDQDPNDDDMGWFYCNDTNVTPIKIDGDEAAKREGMYSKDSRTSAYILFYRRRPSHQSR